MTFLDFREHGLIDIEGLIYYMDLLPGLLMVPLLELTYEVFVDIVGPVIDLEYGIAVRTTGGENTQSQQNTC